MVCVLCGKRGDFPEGLCEECKSLIYRNNDRLELVNILRKVSLMDTLSPQLRKEIDEILKHVPPFDPKKE